MHDHPEQSARESAPGALTRVVMVGHVCIDENTGTGLPEAGQRAAGSPAVFMNRFLQGARAGGDGDPGMAAGSGATRASGATEIAVLAPYGPDFLEVDDALPLLTGPTAARTLLYRNHLDGERRTQECSFADLAHPDPLDARAAAALDAADLVIVCPLLPDFPASYIDSVVGSRRALTVLLAQGGFRRVDADGRIGRAPFAEAERIIPRFDLVVFSDDDVDAPLETARDWSADFPGTVVVVTQNRHGATYFVGGVGTTVPVRTLRGVAGDGAGAVIADGAPDEGNVIGTGDVFSAALAIARLGTADIRAAVATANEAAAAFIETSRSALRAPAAC